jgi:hypothetical protein
VRIIQRSDQQDIVSGRLTKGRLWEIQTLVMHFGRGFLFVVGKAVSMSSTLIGFYFEALNITAQDLRT